MGWQRGISAVEALAGAAVVGIVALGAVQIVKNVGQNVSQVQVSGAARAVRDRIMENIRSVDSWKNTVASNSEMACLDYTRSESQRVACDPSSDFRVFVLKDSKGNDVYHPSSRKRFNLKGEPCALTPEPSGASDECPIEVNVVWKAVCDGVANCKRAQVQLGADFSFKPGAVRAEANFNPRNYNFSFVRGAEGLSGAAACQMLGGTYDSDNIPPCTICPPGELPFYRDGKKRCLAPSSLCSSGQVLVFSSGSSEGYVCTSSPANNPANTSSNTGTNVFSSNSVGTDTLTVSATATDSATATVTSTITDTFTSTSTDTITSVFTSTETATLTATSTSTSIVASSLSCWNGASPGQKCELSGACSPLGSVQNTKCMDNAGVLQPGYTLSCQAVSSMSDPACAQSSSCTYKTVSVKEKCIASSVNGSCSVDFNLASYPEMNGVPASQVVSVFFTYQAYANNETAPSCGTNSGNQFTLDVLQGATATRGGRGKKYWLETFSLQGTRVSVTSEAGGWGGSGGRGCIQDIVAKVKIGEAGCDAASVAKNSPPGGPTVPSEQEPCSDGPSVFGVKCVNQNAN